MHKKEINEIRNKLTSENIDKCKMIKIKQEIEAKIKQHEDNIELREKEQTKREKVMKDEIINANVTIDELKREKRKSDREKDEDIKVKEIIQKCETCDNKINDQQIHGKHMENNHTDRNKDNEQQVQVYNCNDCDYKTNWMSNMKDHWVLKKCKKTKRKKK